MREINKENRSLLFTYEEAVLNRYMLEVLLLIGCESQKKVQESGIQFNLSPGKYYFSPLLRELLLIRDCQPDLNNEINPTIARALHNFLSRYTTTDPVELLLIRALQNTRTLYKLNLGSSHSVDSQTSSELLTPIRESLAVIDLSDEIKENAMMVIEGLDALLQKSKQTGLKKKFHAQIKSNKRMPVYIEFSEKRCVATRILFHIESYSVWAEVESSIKRLAQHFRTVFDMAREKHRLIEFYNHLSGGVSLDARIRQVFNWAKSLSQEYLPVKEILSATVSLEEAREYLFLMRLPTNYFTLLAYLRPRYLGMSCLREGNQSEIQLDDIHQFIVSAGYAKDALSDPPSSDFNAAISTGSLPALVRFIEAFPYPGTLESFKKNFNYQNLLIALQKDCVRDEEGELCITLLNAAEKMCRLDFSDFNFFLLNLIQHFSENKKVVTSILMYILSTEHYKKQISFVEKYQIGGYTLLSLTVRHYGLCLPFFQFVLFSFSEEKKLAALQALVEQGQLEGYQGLITHLNKPRHELLALHRTLGLIHRSILQGNPDLHKLIANNYPELMKVRCSECTLFISFPARPEINRTIENPFPIFVAVYERQIERCKWYLEQKIKYTEEEQYILMLLAANSGNIEILQAVLKKYPDHMSLEILNILIIQGGKYCHDALILLQNHNQFKVETVFKSRSYLIRHDLKSLLLSMRMWSPQKSDPRIFKLICLHIPSLIESYYSFPAQQVSGTESLLNYFIVNMGAEFCNILIEGFWDKLNFAREFEYNFQRQTIKINALHLAMFKHKYITLELILTKSTNLYKDFKYDGEEISPLKFAIMQNDKNLISVLAKFIQWDNRFILIFFPRYESGLLTYLNELKWRAANNFSYSQRGNIFHQMFAGLSDLINDLTFVQGSKYINFIREYMCNNPKLSHELNSESKTPLFCFTHCESSEVLENIINFIDSSQVSSVPNSGLYRGWDFRQYQFMVNANLNVLDELANRMELPKEFPDGSSYEFWLCGNRNIKTIDEVIQRVRVIRGDSPLKFNGPIKGETWSGANALHKAVTTDHETSIFVSQLCSAMSKGHKSLLQAKTREGATPLLFTALGLSLGKNRLAVMQSVINAIRSSRQEIDFSPPHAGLYCGYNILHLTCYMSVSRCETWYADIFKYLLELKPSLLFEQNQNGNTPLHIVAGNLLKFEVIYASFISLLVTKEFSRIFLIKNEVGQSAWGLMLSLSGSGADLSQFIPNLELSKLDRAEKIIWEGREITMGDWIENSTEKNLSTKRTRDENNSSSSKRACTHQSSLFRSEKIQQHSNIENSTNSKLPKGHISHILN